MEEKPQQKLQLPKSAYEPGSINSLVLGDGRPPTFNDGNPYFMGIFYFHPYGLGLMTFPSPQAIQETAVDVRSSRRLQRKPPHRSLEVFQLPVWGWDDIEETKCCLKKKGPPKRSVCFLMIGKFELKVFGFIDGVFHQNKFYCEGIYVKFYTLYRCI